MFYHCYRLRLFCLLGINTFHWKLVRGRLQISFLTLSELKRIIFYPPWNHQKAIDFLMISRETSSLICVNSLNIRSKIWRRSLTDGTFAGWVKTLCWKLKGSRLKYTVLFGQALGTNVLTGVGWPLCRLEATECVGSDWRI